MNGYGAMSSHLKAGAPYLRVPARFLPFLARSHALKQLSGFAGYVKQRRLEGRHYKKVKPQVTFSVAQLHRFRFISTFLSNFPLKTISALLVSVESRRRASLLSFLLKPLGA